MDQIPEILLNTFRKYDTPTILNSLEILDSNFRTKGFTTEQMVCADPSLPPIEVRFCIIPQAKKCPHLAYLHQLP